MAPDRQSLQHLSRLLGREIDCARELLQTLALEYQALTQADTDRIESVAADKRLQLQQLQQCLLEQDRLLQRLGSTGAGPQGIERLLVQASPRDGLHAQWEELRAVTRQLREQNEINGGIVSLGQRHVRQALELLTGRSSDGDTYGPGGGRRSTPAPKTLAKA